MVKALFTLIHPLVQQDIWTKQMLILSREKDMEWLMPDATHI